MRTIFVLFDSLIRSAVGAYGGTAVATPNFDRFAKQRAVCFDNHYVGSLPCMPARRDMHTGRLNFMHRSWGPLEPFDNSFALELGKAGIYTHLVSDHHHYFENGGWGYANTFDSWDFVRGQEYDPVRAMVVPPIERFKEMFDERHYPLERLPTDVAITREANDLMAWRRVRHAVNTLVVQEEKDFPTARCFAGAFEFLEQNKDADDWFLQLECFDPHEPFRAPERFRKAYSKNSVDKILDWPMYEEVSNSPEEIEEIRANYAALVAMCDEYFGTLLDWMDENNAWEDTCLVLTTDHGYLLGEHEWWGKNKMPYYEEISHIPMMVWHPDNASEAGSRRSELTQTADLMPTFLDMYKVPVPEEVTAKSIMPILAKQKSTQVADADRSVIFGIFAGPIGITDGRYAYYHYPLYSDGEGFHLYTLMPSNMTTMFELSDLQKSELVESFDFTKNVPVLKIPMEPSNGEAGVDACKNRPEGDQLFDLHSDPKQENPLQDPAQIAKFCDEIAAHLKEHNAPEEIYRLYGLVEPATAESARRQA